MSLQSEIVAYCRTHGRKASDDSRHVDAEVFSIAADEIERLRAELTLAVDLLQDRVRIRWNPDGYWIDTVLSGKTLAEAIAKAAEAAGGE